MANQAGYYVIISRMHGLALDVESANAAPGTPVIPFGKHGNDNQLWYDDPWSGTIRTKLNGFCLDIEGDQLRIKPHQPGNKNQLLVRDPEGYIRNRHDKKNVVDIYGMKREPGAPIGMYNANGGVNQLWQFEFVGGSPPDHRRYFRIVSEMNKKLVDVQGANTAPGTKVIMWSKTEPAARNQLWFTDYRGCIYSALTGFVFEAKESGKSLKMVPPTGDIKQFWTLADNKKIWNEGGTGECMDIGREDNADGAKVLSYHYKGSANQHWSFEYI